MCVLFLLCIWVSIISISSLQTFNILDYGAFGDGKTKDSKAIQSALDACGKVGNCEVLYPRLNKHGEGAIYLTGSMFVHANMIVRIEGLVLGSKDKQDFPIINNEPDLFHVRNGRHAPLIYGKSVDNLVITGTGTLNARGEFWWPDFPGPMIHRPELELIYAESTDFDYTNDEPATPRVIELWYGKNVLIENIIIENSPNWTIWPNFIENMIIRGISIFNPIDSPNTDCLDPSNIKNLIISNCTLACGDDSVTVKAFEPSSFSEKYSEMRSYYHSIPSVPETLEERRMIRKKAWPYRSENITIENCDFLPGQGMTIGAGTQGGIFDITFRNNVFRGGLTGMRFKQVRDMGGYVDGILFENNEYRSTGVLLSLNMDFTHHPPAKNETRIPRMKNIKMKNIKAWGISSVEINCLPESPCYDIEFETCYWVVCNDWAPCEHTNGTVKNYERGPGICSSFVQL